MFSFNISKLVFAALILAMATFIAGCGGGGATSLAPNPPGGLSVSNPAASPSSLPATGGNVTISASVTGQNTVTAVSAHITGDLVNPSDQPMSLVSGRYATIYNATSAPPPPPSGGSGSYNYTVTITATDNQGNVASATTSFTQASQ